MALEEVHLRAPPNRSALFPPANLHTPFLSIGSTAIVRCGELRVVSHNKLLPLRATNESRYTPLEAGFAGPSLYSGRREPALKQRRDLCCC